MTATRLPAGGGNAFVLSPMIYPVRFVGEVDAAKGVVHGRLETQMQRRWNRVAVPAVVAVALVVAVLTGLVGTWYAAVSVLVVVGALLLWAARMSDKRLATIVHRDLRRMARLPDPAGATA